jgi:hypothetical protein
VRAPLGQSGCREGECVAISELNFVFRGAAAVRVDAKGGSCSGSAGTDQLPNTPRSKHSATEQRRRSKINDRCAPLPLPVR